MIFKYLMRPAPIGLRDCVLVYFRLDVVSPREVNEHEIAGEA